MELYEDPNEREAQHSLVRDKVRETPWMRLAGRDKRQEVRKKREEGRKTRGSTSVG